MPTAITSECICWLVCAISSVYTHQSVNIHGSRLAKNLKGGKAFYFFIFFCLIPLFVNISNWQLWPGRTYKWIQLKADNSGISCVFDVCCIYSNVQIIDWTFVLRQGMNYHVSRFKWSFQKIESSESFSSEISDLWILYSDCLSPKIWCFVLEKG